MERYSVYAQRFKVVKVFGTSSYVTKYIFDDLSDEELTKQFYYYLDREDFEYLEEVIAEATLRNMKFKVNNKPRK